jgi:hypothetical protein
MRLRFSLPALLLMLATVTATAQPKRAGDCDRHCLLVFLTEYTEAVTDNNLSRLAVAPTVRVTSNGQVVELGKGQVWGTGRRLPYRQTFVDPLSGAAVFYGIVSTTSRPARGAARPAGDTAPEHSWFYVVRLRVELQRITEVEEVSYEPAQGGFGANPSSLSLPDRIFDQWLPQSERVSRQQLFDIANKYFDAVSHKIDYHDVPWHPECQRIELGVFTVNTERSPGSCGGEFQTPSVKWNVENRRFYIADVERGIVFAIGNFMTPPEYPNNNGSVVFEVFKVQDGLIRQIHAFFRGNGQAASGWGNGPGS